MVEYYSIHSFSIDNEKNVVAVKLVLFIEQDSGLKSIVERVI